MRRVQGKTLVEMLVVIGIIVLLASIVFVGARLLYRAVRSFEV
jgi:type II secretory pathway pseudopilin PulG